MNTTQSKKFISDYIDNIALYMATRKKIYAPYGDNWRKARRLLFELIDEDSDGKVFDPLDHNQVQLDYSSAYTSDSLCVKLHISGISIHKKDEGSFPRIKTSLRYVLNSILEGTDCNKYSISIKLTKNWSDQSDIDIYITSYYEGDPSLYKSKTPKPKSYRTNNVKRVCNAMGWSRPTFVDAMVGGYRVCYTHSSGNSEQDREEMDNLIQEIYDKTGIKCTWRQRRWDHKLDIIIPYADDSDTEDLVYQYH